MNKLKTIPKLFVFVSLFWIVSSQAQDKDSNEQYFKVENFYIGLPLTGELATSLDFNFDLIFSKEIKNPYKHPYFIHCQLFDGNTKIWENPLNDKVYALRSNKEDAISSYVTHRIPYEDLPLPEGEHQLQLKVSVSNQKKGFPVFFKEDVTIRIPRFYEYEEQHFTFFNSRVTLDRNSFKTPGIRINFTSEAVFVQNQIKGLKDDSFIGEYLFYVEVRNKKTGKRIDFFNPKTAQKSFVVNKIKESHRLFIPFNELNLPQGKYQLEVQVRASTKEIDNKLGESERLNITIVQPELYIMNFTLNNCSVKEKRYDLGSVVGRVFSSAKSNTGKGKPDVYWVLKTGEYIKYSSEVVENNFWAAPGNTTITVLGTDALEVAFWDKDTFSRDDWIASFQLTNGEVGKTIKLNESNTETLENLSLEYHKEAIIFD